MMMNMFSNFDPMWFNLCYKNSLLMMMIMLTMVSMFWHINSKVMLLIMLAVKFMNSQLNTTKLKLLKSLKLSMTTMFIILLYMNIIGLAPYSFSVSSHIMFTVSLSLPSWLLLIMSSFTHSMKNTVAHMLPDNAPLWLNPFLVLIELISVSVRPMTLSFRLAANMTAGHIILMLMLTFSTLSPTMLLTSVIISSAYTIFELMICMVQAYILCLLLSLYSNDHM